MPLIWQLFLFHLIRHGLRRATVSLRLGHGAALTAHRAVIHSRAALRGPQGEGLGVRIATAAPQPRNDSFVTIPSDYSCVGYIDHLGTNCQRRLAADTERMIMGGEYRPPGHELSAATRRRYRANTHGWRIQTAQRRQELAASPAPTSDG